MPAQQLHIGTIGSVHYRDTNMAVLYYLLSANSTLKKRETSSEHQGPIRGPSSAVSSRKGLRLVFSMERHGLINHRILWVGSNLQSSSSPTPSNEQGHHLDQAAQNPIAISTAGGCLPMLKVLHAPICGWTGEPEVYPRIPFSITWRRTLVRARNTHYTG